MDTQKPSVGRVVHYRDEGRCRAAIICNVISGNTVNLQVFGLNATQANTEIRISIELGDEDKNNTWHWPERV